MFVGRRKMGHTSDFIYLCNNFCFEFFLDINVIRSACNQKHISRVCLPFPGYVEMVTCVNSPRMAEMILMYA